MWKFANNMKTNELKIKNVVIKKELNGKLLYILPPYFDGETFRKFKEIHKEEIQNFKSAE